MAGHGAEHGGHAESHAPTSGGGHRGGILKAFGDALLGTIDGVFAEPMAKLGLDAVEETGKVVQAATNLGAKPAGGGGGGHGGGGHH
jgi:hypothetical protein